MVPNLDGMTREELLAFIDRAWADMNSTSIELFGDDDFNHMEAVDDLTSYAMSKRNAMILRASGNIPEALRLEARCDEKYQDLPKWARW